MFVVSPEALKEITKTMNEASASWTSGVCKGGAFSAETGKKVHPGHTACHSWVQEAFGVVYLGDRSWRAWPLEKSVPEDGKHFIIGNCYPVKRNIQVTQEDARFFITWLAQKSPFSKYVVNRDDLSLFTAGMLLLCGPTGLDAAQALWMCKASRILTEGVQGAHVFRFLVEGGVDPMLAFYVCSLVKVVKGSVFSFQGVEGHSSVIQAYSGNCADPRKMIEGIPAKKARETTDVFGVGTREPFNKVSGFCAPITQDDGWGGKTKIQGGKAEDFLAKVLQWQEEEFKDIAVKWDDIKFSTREPKPILPTKDTVYLEVDM